MLVTSFADFRSSLGTRRFGELMYPFDFPVLPGNITSQVLFTTGSPSVKTTKKQKQEKRNILKVCQSKQSYVFLTPSHANSFSYSLILYLFFFAGTLKATKEK